MKVRLLVGGALLAFVVSAQAQAQTSIRAQAPEALIGLPASDVLGSEDIWDNPTFVGGVINGGPTASGEY